MAKIKDAKIQLPEYMAKRKNNLKWIRRTRADLDEMIKQKQFRLAAQTCESLAEFLKKQSTLDRHISLLRHEIKGR